MGADDGFLVQEQRCQFVQPGDLVRIEPVENVQLFDDAIPHPIVDAVALQNARAPPRLQALQHQTGERRRALTTPVLKPSQCIRPR